ncbi:MAG: hypothetical protein HY033_05115 [Ignavibacteriae bacterium]|nr:hypothetical protein [Ignavibacteriota bacterium]
MKKAVLFFVSTLCLCVGIGFLSGCNDSSVVEPLMETQQKATHPAMVSNIIDNLTSGVTLQNLPAAKTSKPQVSVTQSVSANTGGTLVAKFSYVSQAGKTVDVNASLMIPANALTRDQMITMTLDTAYCAVRFQPEGLVFERSAVLGYSATNLTLISSILNFWYDNEEGVFTLLPANISLSLLGDLSATNCQVPHFSRYAFGR